ncbi:hypothetical protein EJB05_32738, partial [Eragrostis curvula]
MAWVLDALAPSVIKMIKDMSKEELTILMGVSMEINKLGGKVENLEAYLADAERRRINETRVQKWVSKLKGALYEATDVLELCYLDAEERRNKQGRTTLQLGEHGGEGTGLPPAAALLPAEPWFRAQHGREHQGAQQKARRHQGRDGRVQVRTSRVLFRADAAQRRYSAQPHDDVVDRRIGYRWGRHRDGHKGPGAGTCVFGISTAH